MKKISIEISANHEEPAEVAKKEFKKAKKPSPKSFKELRALQDDPETGDFGVKEANGFGVTGSPDMKEEKAPKKGKKKSLFGRK